MGSVSAARRQDGVGAGEELALWFPADVVARRRLAVLGHGLVASLEPATFGRGEQRRREVAAAGHLPAAASGRRLHLHVHAVDEQGGGLGWGRGPLPAGLRLQRVGGPSGVGWFLAGFGGRIPHNLLEKQFRTAP